MKSIWIIAFNTYREIIRDRVLYAIFVFAIMLIGLSLALGQLSFAEQSRITTSFGLAAIQLSAAVLSIFLGSSLVTKEIEKKTIMTLLVRPLTRLQFLLGKSLGLLMLQLTVMTVLASVLVAIFLMTRIEVNTQMFVALHGILLEAIVLLGVALFFSIFAAPMMVVAFTIGLFLIGHWLGSLVFFMNKSKENTFAEIIGWLVPKVIPDLERFNWRAAVIHADPIVWNEVGVSTLHSLAWFVFLIILAGWIFNRRDFA